jgi:hypothetical protein
MAALVPARTARQEMRLLAQRIDVSQKDEMAMMRGWLSDRGLAVPAEAADHLHHDVEGRPLHMPGMLTADEMARLADATGTAFERLFLEGMIKRHQGPHVVKELFGAGAAQKRSSSASRRMWTRPARRINRMNALLNASRPRTPDPSTYDFRLPTSRLPFSSSPLLPRPRTPRRPQARLLRRQRPPATSW